MRTSSLTRMGGLAAAIAGALRIITLLILVSSPSIVLLYFLVDAFLVFGSIGLYALQEEEIGTAGTGGFLLQLVDLLVLIARDLGGSAPGLYAAGAIIFALGLSGRLSRGASTWDLVSVKKVVDSVALIFKEDHPLEEINSLSLIA